MAALVSGRKAVAAAGTAEPLTATSVSVNTISIMAMPSNTGVVVIGGADVVAAVLTRKGIVLRATDPPVTYRSSDGVDEVGDIYVDAMTNGEGVIYTYTPAS